MKLVEIFVDSPELIQHPEVMALIEHSRQSYANIVERLKAMQDKEFKQIETLMNSDACIIDGRPIKDAVREVLDRWTA